VDDQLFTISFLTRSGRVYAREYKDSLSDIEWTGLPLAAGDGSRLLLTDTTAIVPQRFYRVRIW